MQSGQSETRIAILLSTCNGERYLPELLDSLLGQHYRQWDLWIRDDGSTDGTVDLLNTFHRNAAEDHPDNRIQITTGENIGIVGSFFSLLADVPDTYSGYAFCDQDDVWQPEKLDRAVDQLNRHLGRSENPFLYHARQFIMDERGTVQGVSPVPQHCGLFNALIQNQVVGCTMVIDSNLRKRVIGDRERPFHPDPAIIMHDWWCYLLASAFGIIYYDDRPVIKFRRHEQSSTPAKSGRYRAWAARAAALGNRSWSITHILDQAELYHNRYIVSEGGKVTGECSPDNVNMVNCLLKLKKAGFGKRLEYVLRSPHYRSTWPETLVFRFMVLFRRF